MSYLITQMLFCLLLAAAIGLVVGWLSKLLWVNCSHESVGQRSFFWIKRHFRYIASG